MQYNSLLLKSSRGQMTSLIYKRNMLAEKDSEWGYIAEVDLEFPEKVQGYFKNYPPAPSKEVVEMSDLSTNQVKMVGGRAITSLPKVPKLIQSLQRKEGYVLHYLTLQLYVQ